MADGETKRVDVDGQAILLYRAGSSVSAISAVCAHAGGPLEEGKVADGCVECPWHQSVYDLKSGAVVHGPTTFPQPAYDTRITKGQVELRVKQS